MPPPPSAPWQLAQFAAKTWRPGAAGAVEPESGLVREQQHDDAWRPRTNASTSTSVHQPAEHQNAGMPAGRDVKNHTRS